MQTIKGTSTNMSTTHIQCCTYFSLSKWNTKTEWIRCMHCQRSVEPYNDEEGNHEVIKLFVLEDGDVAMEVCEDCFDTLDDMFRWVYTQLYYCRHY